MVVPLFHSCDLLVGNSLSFQPTAATWMPEYYLGHDGFISLHRSCGITKTLALCALFLFSLPVFCVNRHLLFIPMIYRPGIPYHLMTDPLPEFHHGLLVPLVAGLNKIHGNRYSSAPMSQPVNIPQPGRGSPSISSSGATR